MPQIENKLYRVERDYGNSVIIELCWARDEEDVHTKLKWEKDDKPSLKITEITERDGCILSLAKEARRWI